jgi:hypothetical protein
MFEDSAYEKILGFKTFSIQKTINSFYLGTHPGATAKTAKNPRPAKHLVPPLLLVDNLNHGSATNYTYSVKAQQSHFPNLYK